MRRILILSLIIISVLMLTACSTSDINTVKTDITHASFEPPPNTQAASQTNTLVAYLTFEQALLSSTDVVVAQYIGQRPFGENLTEFEFVVLERVLGNAADTIFVYAANDYASVLIDSASVTSYNQGDLMFGSGINYLLVLQRLQGATLRTHEDGFIFIHNLIVNLDNPTLSTMYNAPLYAHSSEMNFESSSLTENQIISFIELKTANNPPARERIRSDGISDVVNSSPYILIIEINEPRRLLHEQVTRDWMETDIYFCTIVRVLKGNVDVDLDISVIFFANTVTTGEQHIIAVERIAERSTTFELTSQNSLFRMEQLDEIMMLLNLVEANFVEYDYNESDYDFDESKYDSEESNYE